MNLIFQRRFSKRAHSGKLNNLIPDCYVAQIVSYYASVLFWKPCYVRENGSRPILACVPSDGEIP
jgi:hypothetical protein